MGSCIACMVEKCMWLYVGSPFSTACMHAVADDNTAVYEVFRAHFDQLVKAMGTSPTALIPVLYIL